ncbi:cupin domain-containing protein [Cyclobacterium marinum]|uniref:cupin domain-containing protein n=1 Tax=Cyclobacterium marinum TaxID=104 RepID=UPI0011ED6D4E|nr:cupin domain-containing protein [Cyclobacterium marinum]MBI0398568.1 cupin domain-containing protein [Cyclobacterium marinum]
MKYIACFLIMLWNTPVQAQLMPLPSAVYEYNMMAVNVEKGTEIRPILDGPTETLDNFRVKHFSLSDGKSLKLKKGEEKLVLIFSGELQVNQGMKSENLESRSVAWLTKDQPANIHHSGDSPVSFFVVEWESEQVGKDFKPEFNSLTKFNYRQLEFKKSAKGGRRDVSRGATPTLQELEMHITTLKEGEKSHDPHVHADEEIILVLQGQVEEMINGVPYLLGPGSLIYLHAMDAHGIRNAGKGKCEYYAIRWITKNTGK